MIETMATNTQSKFYIRFATEQDVDLILTFIKELAEYEKLLNEVVATPEILRKSLFGPRKNAEVILIHYHNEPVGFALFFHNFSTFLGKPGIYIEDLYVKQELRGKGLGQALLNFIAKLAKERDCGRVEWWVLDWNEDAIRFYQKIGAIPMNEWTVFQLTGQALEDMANK
jgi:GNAT superfamily N-acetyltransferase